MNATRASKPVGWWLAALAVTLLAAPAVVAQDAEPSTLAASDAEDLLGKWELAMDFDGTPIPMTAEFKEEDGNVVCVVTSAVQPGELVISDIARDGNKLALKGSIEMGEGDQATTMNLTIDMEVDGDTATGHVKDDAGLIDAPVTGGKAGADDGWPGTWDLSMDFQGREVNMTLELMEADGKMTGKLTNARNPDGTAIEDITKTDDGLELKYQMDRGGQMIDLVMTLAKAEDGIKGTLGDTAGFFSADLTGKKAGGEETGDAPAGEASSLDVSEAQNLLGTWDLSMEFQGNPVGMTLTVTDMDGKVGASIVAPTSPDPVNVTDITKTDDGFDLKYGVEFGGNPVDLTLALKIDGESAAGTLSDSGGFFSADVAGEKGEGGEEGGEPFEVTAEDTSDLDAAEAEGYLGGWKLAMELRGNPFNMNLIMQDVEGKVGAFITSQFAPEPALIEQIEMTDEGLKMVYEAEFGPQRLDINIVAKLDGDQLTGSFADAGGLISSDFTGTRLSEDEIVQASQQPRRRGRRGRGDTGDTSIKVGGKEVEIAYATLKTDSEDYETLANLKEGEVFEFARGRATKLLTETDMHFGDVVLKQGNAHETYPGVYSLWLKKTADGWHMVANEHADIWGTQHEPEVDYAEIPLTYAKADESKDVFEVELVEDEEDQGGTLNIAWGEHQWTAKFSTQ